MRFILDEIYSHLKQNLNIFLEEKGLPPFKRIALGSFSSDITPSLGLLLKETKIAGEFASPRIKTWKGIFLISILLREEGERSNAILGSYVQAICDFLESGGLPSSFKTTCGKITPAKLQKPSFRGLEIEFEVLYQP